MPRVFLDMVAIYNTLSDNNFRIEQESICVALKFPFSTKGKHKVLNNFLP